MMDSINTEVLYAFVSISLNLSLTVEGLLVSLVAGKAWWSTLLMVFLLSHSIFMKHSLILAINFFSAFLNISWFLNITFFFERCSGIQKQISTSSAARKFLALTLIKVSLAYMEMKRIYEVHDTYDALFIICSYLIVCFKSFFCLSLLVMAEDLMWSFIWFTGYVSEKRAKASNVYCCFGGLVVGESGCCFIVAITYVGQKAYLQENSIIYWDIEGSIHKFYFLFRFVRFIFIVKTDVILVSTGWY